MFISLSKNSKITWTPACEVAFVQLKTILSSFKSDSEENGILALPNFEHPFILETDASNIGVGAVLSQKIDSVTRPIGYYSKPLSTAQRNYAVIERKLYAIVVSIEHFSLLFSIEQLFTNQLDSLRLSWFMVESLSYRQISYYHQNYVLFPSRSLKEISGKMERPVCSHRYPKWSQLCFETSFRGAEES